MFLKSNLTLHLAVETTATQTGTRRGSGLQII
jgi:hypothetical protein